MQETGLIRRVKEMRMDKAFSEAVESGDQRAWDRYTEVVRSANLGGKKKKFGEGDLPPQIIGGSPRDPK
ncbi:MAG: hypothetical protein IT416_00625 [Candidatus Pacebacteria bacterium]|nr:hypothetical protein [Candidatus Paceibacterota bacterium]